MATSDTFQHDAVRQNLEQAKASLAKLPLLGPAIWLYANAAEKKFTFVGDVQALLLPPLVLDQCRVYNKDGIPWVFLSWAKVNDDIHARLSSGIARLAPHEWNSGSHVWLIDTVAPFGGLDECIEDLRTKILPGTPLHGFMPDTTVGKINVRNWPAT